MHIHRQRQGEVALVLEEMVAKTHGGEHQRREAQRHDTEDEADGDEDRQQVEQPGEIVLQHALGGAHGKRQREHPREDGPHDAARGTKFVPDEFGQHLNTSRNSVSTLMPFSSRI